MTDSDGARESAGRVPTAVRVGGPSRRSESGPTDREPSTGPWTRWTVPVTSVATPTVDVRPKERARIECGRGPTEAAERPVSRDSETPARAGADHSDIGMG